MDIVALVKSQLGDAFAGAATNIVGLGAEQTRSAVGAAIPAVLAGIVGAARTKPGKEALGAALRHQEPGLLSQIPEALTGGQQQSLIGSGIETMTALLGSGKLSGLIQAFGGFTGLDQMSARSLLGLVTPVAMGVIGNEQRSRSMDFDGVVSMLQGQKANIANAMPSGLASALASTGLLDGLGDVARKATSTADATVRATAQTADRAPRPAPAQPRSRNWGLIAAAIAGVAVLGWLFTRGPDRDPDIEPARQAAIDEPAERAGAASLVVGDIDVGRQFAVITDGLAETMSAVRDEASAEAALPELAQLTERLDDLAPLMDRLPPDAKPAFAAMARDTVADLQTHAARISSMSNVPDAVRQTVSQLADTLAEFSA